ncbi:MAG: hypothetical protein LBU25_01470 [Treponema sp.]|nr:hypothetical protein [Treponema sp.]
MNIPYYGAHTAPGSWPRPARGGGIAGTGAIAPRIQGKGPPVSPVCAGEPASGAAPLQSADFSLTSLEAVLESMDADLQSADFSLTSLEAILKSVDFDSESVDFDLESMDFDLESMDFDLESVDSDLESVDSDLKSVDSDLESMDSDLESVDSDLESALYMVSTTHRRLGKNGKE